MKYFITGATGFIGGEIARQLVEAGHQVVALARPSSSVERLVEMGVSISRGDVTDKESMREPMSGVDGLFHVAAWYHLGSRSNGVAESINFIGTRNVLELMRELQIPKGVYTSTLAVFSDTHGKAVDESYYHAGPWLSEYDRTKWMAHYQAAVPLMKAGLPLVIVMPGLVYGPGDRSPSGAALIQYIQGRLPAVPRGTAYCWGHVDDTARGHIQAMEKGTVGESYILAGPVHTFAEALDMAQEITGIRVPRLRPGPRTMRTVAPVAGLAGRVFRLSESYSKEVLRVMAGVTYLGSSAKAERELGFSARPLSIGLRETLSYEMARLGIRPRR